MVIIRNQLFKLARNGVLSLLQNKVFSFTEISTIPGQFEQNSFEDLYTQVLWFNINRDS